MVQPLKYLSVSELCIGTACTHEQSSYQWNGLTHTHACMLFPETPSISQTCPTQPDPGSTSSVIVLHSPNPEEYRAEQLRKLLPAIINPNGTLIGLPPQTNFSQANQTNNII